MTQVAEIRRQVIFIKENTENILADIVVGDNEKLKDAIGIFMANTLESLSLLQDSLNRLP